MTPIQKLHGKIREEVEKVQEETGAFISSIAITWGDADQGRTITEVSCFMGTSTKYTDKSGYQKAEEKEDG